MYIFTYSFHLSLPLTAKQRTFGILENASRLCWRIGAMEFHKVKLLKYAFKYYYRIRLLHDIVFIKSLQRFNYREKIITIV